MAGGIRLLPARGVCRVERGRSEELGAMVGAVVTPVVSAGKRVVEVDVVVPVGLVGLAELAELAGLAGLVGLVGFADNNALVLVVRLVFPPVANMGNTVVDPDPPPVMRVGRCVMLAIVENPLFMVLVLPPVPSLLLPRWPGRPVRRLADDRVIFIPTPLTFPNSSFGSR